MNGKFETEIRLISVDEITSEDRTLCTQPIYTGREAITIEIDLVPGTNVGEALSEISGALENLGLDGP